MSDEVKKKPPGYEARWEEVSPLGIGGQGKVSRVRRKKNQPDRDKLRKSLLKLITEIAREDATLDSRYESVDELYHLIRNTIDEEDRSNHGALKVIKLDGVSDPEKAAERIAREIQAMSEVEHPNLLRIIERIPQEHWYVSEYHPNGTLADMEGHFAGDVPASLKMLRPIVAAVAELHEKDWVHRDIKPQNIFMSTNNEPILGDFGLVYFADSNRTRVSDTYENVGSWEWMPGWAIGVRIEKIRPRFDVFCLGKILWWMVSGKNVQSLRGHYFAHDRYDSINVEKLFPDARFIDLVNPLLAKCVVEHDDEGLRDARLLLKEIDQCLTKIEMNAEPMVQGSNRLCRVCAEGHYELAVDQIDTTRSNFGFNGNKCFRIFQCDKCGHVQFFNVGERQGRSADADANRDGGSTTNW